MESDGGSPHEGNRGISQVKAQDKIGVFNDTSKTIWVKTVSRLSPIKNFAIHGFDFLICYIYLSNYVLIFPEN